MAKGTDDSIIVVIKVTVWIQEFLKDIYLYIHKQYWWCFSLVVCFHSILLFMPFGTWLRSLVVVEHFISLLFSLQTLI